MKRWLIALLLVVLACCVARPVRAASHIVLVQNSGWMEPFYQDPASQFKPLTAELAKAILQPGDALLLAAFNQSQPGQPSPKALLSLRYDGANADARIAQAVASLALAHKPGGALADTDMGEALQAALAQQAGLIWLITNNRNSPNNDQATARRNREFYQLIHGGAQIHAALAFPLHMPVQGAQYHANGLMVYVFAIGAQGARELAALMATGRVQRLITEPPARLKPLDRDTVRLAAHRVSEAPGLSFSSTPGGVLVADVAAQERAPVAAIGWQLENTVYPYTITSARISARSVLGGEEKPIELATQAVRALAPGATMPLDSRMAMPVAQMPGKWSWQALGAAGSAYVLPGKVELQLAEQQLELSPAFRSRMAALFPGDPLPDIFVPPAQVHSAHASLALQVQVHYGLGPLLALIGALTGTLAAGGAAAYYATRPRRVHLVVEGEPRELCTRPGHTHAIFDKSGIQLAQLKTTFFGHQLTDLREGAQVRLGRL